jgi:hypothetical protein
VATWIKREHQQAFETVFAKRNRLICPFSGKAQHNRKATQRTPSQDLAISNASGEVRRVCCVDRLRSPRKGALRCSGIIHFGLTKEQTLFAQISEKLIKAILKDGTHALEICRLCDSKACTGCPVETELLRRSET